MNNKSDFVEVAPCVLEKNGEFFEEYDGHLLPLSPETAESLVKSRNEIYQAMTQKETPKQESFFHSC